MGRTKKKINRPSRSCKHWTEEELKWLKEHWALHTPKRIARDLERTLIGIKQKAFSLGLRQSDIYEEIPLRQLFLALGYSESGGTAIYDVYLKRGLPVIKRKRKKNKILFICIDKFWQWAEKNKSIMNLSKLEKGALGVEPDWVDEKRKIDIINSSKSKYTIEWTDREDRLLISKAKSGRYTVIDLSIEFKRSQQGIKNRLDILYVPLYVLKEVPKKNWSSEEIDKLIYMLINNYNLDYIANNLYRTTKSINSKIRRLIRDGILIKNSVFFYVFV